MYSWGDERRFNSYSRYFRELMGARVQKVAINAGFGCPNRMERAGDAGFGADALGVDAGTGSYASGVGADSEAEAGLGAHSGMGSRTGVLSAETDSAIGARTGAGGCTFCNNEAFTPSYCVPSKSITRQIDEGIEFHARRYRHAEKYLAYFQSFSNTYAPLERLREVYDEALAHPLVAGIVVGTRPDCVDEEKIAYFAELARTHYVAIEYGIESTFDETLRAVNRGHDFECARRAVEMTAQRNLHVGAHFILGFPGETDEMLIAQADTINSLPLTTVKFHQLQIFRDTVMEREYERNPEQFTFREPDEYIDFFTEILRRLRPSLVVERFTGEAPPRHRVGQGWGSIRNEKLLSMLEKRLEELDARQGDLYVG